MSGDKSAPPINDETRQRDIWKAVFEASLTVYCTHRVPMGLVPRQLTGHIEGQTEPLRIRESLIAMQGPDRVSNDDVEIAKFVMSRKCDQAFDDLVNVCDAYTDLVLRLGLEPAQVEGYIHQERRLLASLYFAAREQDPSIDRLFRLAYRLALDARTPIEGSLAWLACERHGNGWQVARYNQDEDGLRLLGLPPSGPRITTLSPLARNVFECLLRDFPGTATLTTWIEAVYHAQPQQSDTLESVDARTVEYVIENQELRLWAAGVEILGIGLQDEQAILKYFCRDPRAKVPGKELESRLMGSIANASQGARRIKQAFRVAIGPTGDWFLTRPLRWADGVSVRKR